MNGWTSLMRHTTLLFLVLAVGLALVLFSVKYQVQDLEDELTEINERLASERTAIHVLRAEWSYLTQPDRLRRLSERYLHLTPLAPSQLGSFASLPIPAHAPASPVPVSAPDTEPAPEPASPTSVAALEAAEILGIKLDMVAR
jgi:hypothetical protein